MSTPLAESTWPACRSALALDRLIHGELAEAEASPLRAHVESCARCQPVFAELQRAALAPLPPLRELFGAPTIGIPTIGTQTNGVPTIGIQPVGTQNIGTPIKSPPGELKLVPELEARSRSSREPAPLSAETAPARRAARGRFAVRLSAAGAAAAALFFCVAELSVWRDPESASRSKGSGFSLGMYVQHGADVRRAGPGELVHPGDAVRFAVSAKESGYAAVLSLDPAQRASIYFPQGPRAALVAAGGEVALPLSTRLDATVGEEQLLGLLCKEPIALEPVRQSLERGSAQVPEGCQVARLFFVKH